MSDELTPFQVSQKLNAVYSAFLHTELVLQEQHAEIERLRADAERYRELASRAHKIIAYDRYGNSTHWAIRFFADDGHRTLAAAIDAEIRARRER